MRPTLRMFLSLALLTCIALPAVAKDADPEMAAANQLWKYLERTLPKRGLSTDCITIIDEDPAPMCYQYAIQEKHGGKCPGDPDTSPIVDRYRVGKKNHLIRKWDPVTDKWQTVH